MTFIFLFEWQICAVIEKFCKVWKYGIIPKDLNRLKK